MVYAERTRRGCCAVKEIAAHIERAHESLKAAQLLLNDDLSSDAVSRAYYACLHVAKAALLSIEEAPRTHKGIHNRFWVQFVESGRIPRAVGDVLAYAWKMREQADYDVLTRFDPGSVADLLRDVAGFVEAVAGEIDSLDA